MAEEISEKNISENLKIEDRYKLTFIQMDERFINLELAIGDLNEKIKSLDLKAISDLKQKIEDLEDMAMVENFGVLELKKLLDTWEKKIENVSKENKLPLSPENLNEISSLVLPNLESSIALKVEERLSKIGNVTAPADIASLEKKVSSLSNQLNTLIIDVREKNKTVDQEMIQKIVSEISDLRTEFSKEIIYLKEKIEGEKSTKSEIDIKFLGSRVNTLKETIDYILNRKTELDLKVQNLEKGLAVMRGMTEQIIPDENLKRLDIKIDSLEKGIENWEKKFENLERLAGISQEFERKLEAIKKTEGQVEHFMMPIEINRRLEVLEEKINSLKEEIEQPKEKPYESKPDILDEQINELLNKIIFLESRIRAIESMLLKGQQTSKAQPVILE